MIEPTPGTTAKVLPAAGAQTRREAEARPAEPRTEAVQSQAAEAVERTLRSLDPPLMGQNERLSISKDEATGLFIYRSIDKETGEVVNQWPAESMLQFKAYLRREGLAFDAQA